MNKQENEFKIHKRSVLPGWINRQTGIVLAVIFIIGFVIFGSGFKNLFIIGIWIILGSLSLFYKRFFEYRMGLEFVFPGTVLCAIAYGPVVGIIVGNVGNFMAELISARPDERVIPAQIAYTITALIAQAVYAATLQNIFLAGMILWVIYHAVMQPMMIVFGGDLFKTVLFVSTHFVWSIVFFWRIAPFILPLMTL
ncbi:hypothetical protein J4475_03835 [Candidatus Woesearchaeota archaeon]|nr:hypothetical protein [Candidatus Woesearchaeota archaeon]